MTDHPLTNDASASTRGTIYQFYVALLKCFEMVTGQKVMLERFGDVTVSGSQQIEIKHIEAPLTDNDPALWKTLKNWMQDGFDETMYSSLILLTTQRFGPRCRFSKWNQKAVSQRQQILAEIGKEAEDREVERQQKRDTQPHGIPESLSLQRFVLDPSKSAKLHKVVEKLVIASGSPDINGLYEQISGQYCKGVLEGKRSSFLGSLLEFVAHPPSDQTAKWEISYDGFAAKVMELTTTYCRETRIFPTKYIEGANSLGNAEIESHQNRRFVQKIVEIEYNEVVTQSIGDYVAASLTVLKEFENYEVPSSRYDQFVQEILGTFRPCYRAAARNVSDVIKDSQTLFDKVTGEEPPVFHGFQTPPRAFRNGVLHMQMDDDKTDLKWKLG